MILFKMVSQRLGQEGKQNTSNSTCRNSETMIYCSFDMKEFSSIQHSDQLTCGIEKNEQYTVQELLHVG